MVRLIALVIGLGFVLVSAVSFFFGFAAWVSEEGETAAHYDYSEPERINFSFNGPFGTFDRQQLQRGFQVYKEVCAGCHSLNLVAFRNLQDLGYTEAEVRAIADQWAIQVPSVNPETGEAATRKAIPADTFPSPYPNEVAARAANNNALPPDLSLITKAREGGPEYVASLLMGYSAPPAGHEVPEGLHYNRYFPNLNIAMPAPLQNGQVTYADGTEATVPQMSQDVTAFLAWSAEPTMETRRSMGFAVLIFLFAATALAFLAYKNVWADKKAKKGKPATA